MCFLMYFLDLLMIWMGLFSTLRLSLFSIWKGLQMNMAQVWFLDRYHMGFTEGCQKTKVFRLGTVRGDGSTITLCCFYKDMGIHSNRICRQASKPQAQIRQYSETRRSFIELSWFLSKYKYRLWILQIATFPTSESSMGYLIVWFQTGMWRIHQAFWRHLMKKRRVHTHMSSTHNPQTETKGSLTLVNRMLHNFLRCYYSLQQDDWAPFCQPQNLLSIHLEVKRYRLHKFTLIWDSNFGVLWIDFFQWTILWKV